MIFFTRKCPGYSSGGSRDGYSLRDGIQTLATGRAEWLFATLKEGRHLQLGLYAALLQESRGSPPAALGYYIFDTRTLLTTSAGVFPQAKVCPSKSGITLEGLLTQARKSWEWRSGQWAEGVVEVVDERLAAMSDFQGEEGVLQVAALGPWNREYVALLGWSES